MSWYRIANGIPTAPNGMNLNRSIGNPNSRFERIRTFLAYEGPSTKRDILFRVFGKTVPAVSLGWASYVFNLGVKQGYWYPVRKDRTVYWTLR